MDDLGERASYDAAAPRELPEPSANPGVLESHGAEDAPPSESRAAVLARPAPGLRSSPGRQARLQRAWDRISGNF